MIPLDIELVQLIATHLTNVRQGLEEGFLSVTLGDDDDTDPAHLRAMLIKTEDYLINALQQYAVQAMLATLEGQPEQVVPTKDNVLMFPTETIEA